MNHFFSYAFGKFSLSLFALFLLASAAVFYATIKSRDVTQSGQWSERTQLVAGLSGQALVRKSLKVWDPYPQQNLEFYWEPAIGEPAIANGPVEGSGVLTWRIRGTASYDRRAEFSRYKGQMRNGKPHGKGRLETRDVLIYEGDFQNGFKHGRGSLQAENGDQYEGQFANGLPHGKGRYAHATGKIYEGQFKAGKRHGKGVLTEANGNRITSLWRDGVDERVSKPLILTQWADSENPFIGRGSSTYLNNISISLVTDQKRYQRMKADYVHGTYYNHKLDRNTISIMPKDKKLLKIWKGGGWMFDTGSWWHGFGYWSIAYNVNLPVFLKFSIKSKSSNTAVVERVELEIIKSETEWQPFLGIQPHTSKDECSAGYATPLSPFVGFGNIGWGNAENASISYAFTKNKKAGRVKNFPFKQSVGTVVGSAENFKSISIAPSLEKSGVNVAALKKFIYKCPSRDDIKKCRVDILKSFNWGKLKPHVYIGGINGDRVLTNIEGKMDYRWKDSDSKSNKATSKFRQSIILASITFPTTSECGAGGPEDPKAGIPILNLKLDKTNYRVRYPLKKNMRLANQTLTFPFGLTADKSSSHLFRLVVHFKDGSKKLSKPIKLLYVKFRENQLQ